MRINVIIGILLILTGVIVYLAGTMQENNR